MQSVPITTDVVSSDLDQGEVYTNIWSSFSVGGYLLVLPFSPQIKLTADHKHKPHTQISIKDQVYIYLNTADCTQNALIQFIQKHFLFWIVGHTIQIMLL
jgi:ABC-type thiamine transport system substrate-binding protein